MRKPLDQQGSCRPIFHSCVSKLFERIKFFIILNQFRIGFTNPSRALGQFLPLSIIPRLEFSGTSLFFTSLLLLVPILALLDRFSLSFPTDALEWFSKITKVVSFEFAEVFRKDSFLTLFYFLFISTVSMHLCFPSSAVLYMLMNRL